jgi:hypothetical protein
VNKQECKKFVFAGFPGDTVPFPRFIPDFGLTRVFGLPLPIIIALDDSRFNA